RQMSFASARMALTSDGDRSADTATLTTSGSGRVTSGRAASGEMASAATIRPVAMSILPAVDGGRAEKFDVRSRHDRASTPHTVQRWDQSRVHPRAPPPVRHLDRPGGVGRRYV